MSIEYFGYPKRALENTVIKQLLDELAGVNGFKEVRRSETELGLISSDWSETKPEMISIILAPNSIYVCFNQTNRIEEKQLVAYFDSLLQRNGIDCHLEEE